MVLTYLGIPCTQDGLAHRLNSRPRVGTPHARIERLRSPDLEVIYAARGDAETLRGFIERALPVIVFVQTAELPYWDGHVSRHAILVAGIDDTRAHVLDPAMPPDLFSVPLGDFMLAWDEMDNTYTVLRRRQ
jgi:hypothetical protein